MKWFLRMVFGYALYSWAVTAMGYKVSDGKAVDVTMPAQVINDGDLYRVGGWNGFAIGAKDASQADRTMSLETDPAAIYSFKVPAGVNPAVGAYLWWTTNDATTFQDGAVHLLAADPAAANTSTEPCVKISATKNAAGYCQGRVLQSATLDTA